MHVGIVLALSLALADCSAANVHDEHTAILQTAPMALATSADTNDERALWSLAVVFVIIVVAVAGFFTGYYVGTTAGRSSAIVNRSQQTTEVSTSRVSQQLPPVHAVVVADTSTHIRPTAKQSGLDSYRIKFEE